MEQPVSVSAVVIARDEASRIAACVRALAAATAEVVVADTGSSDATPALAEQAGARVVRRPWDDDFSAARNFAAGQAAHDWILQVDADETLLDPNAARVLLRDFTDTASNGTLGVVTLENLTATGERVYQHSPRLYHRAGNRFTGRIHEQLVPIGGTSTARDTGIRLLHTGYALDPDALRAKCDRNRRLLEQALAESPGDPYLWFQMGKGHFLTEAKEEAERCFRKALSLMIFAGSSRPRDLAGAPLDDDIMTDLLTSMAYVYCRLGRPAEAVALLQEQEALGHPAALRPDTPHALGYALIQTGDLDGAWAAYVRALGCDPASEQVRGTAGFASLFHLGLLCEGGERHTEAFKFYLLALLQEPAHRPTLERCVGLIAEKEVLLPEPVLEAADQAALSSVFAGQVLEHEQRGNRAASGTLLCAAREMSEPLYQACVAALHGHLNPP